MADNRKLTAGLLKMPEAQRQDLARMGEEYKRFQEADYLRKMGEQGMGLAKSVARGVPQMATGLVDLAAMPFEAAGVLQPGQAVGSTKWLESKGYLPEQQEGFLNQTAELLSGGFDPSDLVTKGAPLLMGIGKTVWHGSPHTFDKFDMSKIGTGEGSQAFAHGLYLAEAPETAKSYQAMANNPARRQGGLRGEGKEQAMMDSLIRLNAKKYTEGDVNKLAELVAQRPAAFTNPEKMIARIGEYENNAAPSYLYKVDLPDEQIAKMFDWDNPISEEMRKPISNSMMEKFGSGLSFGTGEQAYKQIVDEFRLAGSKDPRADASQWLYQQGVPGVQYLDEASRGAGEGTRNYVVFSDEIPQILERNNIPVNK